MVSQEELADLRSIDRLRRRAREKRWTALCVVNLRLLIGFAFLPAGLKKILGEPFTDPEKVGAFHEFLHAFLATGPFYRFVGLVQLIAACLLMTQRFACLGAAIMFPVLVAIGALCWSTGVGIPTLTTVTLMGLGTLGLLLWDMDQWRGLLTPEGSSRDIRVRATQPLVDYGLWAKCGWAVLATYAIATVANGGVYRPRTVELENPAFYLLPLITLYPLITWRIDRSRYRRRSRG